MNQNIMETAAAIQTLLIERKATLNLNLKGFPTLYIMDDETGTGAPFIAASAEAEKRGLWHVPDTES